MNEKLEALLKSINHWIDVVVDPVNTKIGAPECALCQRGAEAQKASLAAKVRLPHHVCHDCPVAAKTGKGYCINTPYAAFSEAMEDYKTTASPAPAPVAFMRLRKLAAEELRFLVSLVPDCQSTDEPPTYREANAETLMTPQRQDHWPRS